MNLYQDDIEAGQRIHSYDLGPDLTVEYWIARAAARRVATSFLNKLLEKKHGPKYTPDAWEEFLQFAREVAPD